MEINKNSTHQTLGLENIWTKETMTGDNHENATNESARPRRKGNEQAIKDCVVIIGSVMMIMCFGLLLEVNIRKWHKLDHKIMTIAMFLGICVVTFLFGLYFYSRLNSCRDDIDEQILDEAVVSLFLFIDKYNDQRRTSRSLWHWLLLVLSMKSLKSKALYSLPITETVLKSMLVIS